MNKQIKFRAFVRGYMTEVVSIDFVNKYITWDDNQYDRCVPPNKCLEMESFEEIKLLQFTGLFDKDGKEIYEGDIVSFEDDPADVIVWSNEAVAFIFCELSKIDKNRSESFYDEFSKMRWDHQKHYIIQGNIYQNPELIKQD